MNGSRTSLFRRGSWLEARRIAEVLRQETVGGALVWAPAVVAPVWANFTVGAGVSGTARL